MPAYRSVTTSKRSNPCSAGIATLTLTLDHLTPYSLGGLNPCSGGIDALKKGFGDGIIYCNAETLENEVTLFELPFAPTENSLNSVAGYGTPCE